MIFGCGNGLCFGKRHEDRAFIIAQAIRVVINAADRKQLLIHIAIRGGHQQVDFVVDV